MGKHTTDYWVGSLAMTVALAAKDPHPKPLLQSALKQFLAERPPGCELAQLIRTAGVKR